MTFSDSERSENSRRSVLKAAGVAGVTAISGTTAFSMASQPALALSDPVTLPSGLTEGSVTVPSYELQYAELDTTSDITINYVLRTDAGTKTTESHVVSITESTGAVMTGDHLISIPAGEVSLEVQLEHSSVGTVSTNESAPTTVKSAIPDSGLLHNYDWSDSATTTSTVPDLAGSTDLTGTFTNLSADINGNQAGTFDGNDDEVNGDYPNVSEPYDIFLVARFRSPTQNEIAINSISSGTHQFYIASGPSWGIFQDSTVTGGTTDSNAHLFTTGWATTDILRIDETDVLSGDSGMSDMTGLNVGSAQGSNYAAIDVGEVAVYDADASGYSRTDVESYFVSKWGPF